MPVKRGLIPNMGDVSQATRVQLSGMSRGSSRGTRRRRRSSGRKRAARSKRSSGTGKRKLKFGSKAWRAKYSPKKRRRRRG